MRGACVIELWCTLVWVGCTCALAIPPSCISAYAYSCVCVCIWILVQLLRNGFKKAKTPLHMKWGNARGDGEH